MQHFWGSSAIRARLCIGSDKTLYRYVKVYRCPIMKRVNPRNPLRTILYTNSDLLIAWELAMCEEYRQHLLSGQTPPEPVRIVESLPHRVPTTPNDQTA
jgi:hypothetical protein